MTDQVQNPNPRNKANIFSICFFTYTLETFRKGRDHFWNENNIYEPPEFLRSEKLGSEIDKLWLKHVKKCKLTHKKPNVNLVLFQMFWRDLLKDGLLLFLSQFPKIFQPFLLGRLLDYFSSQREVSPEDAYWCVFLLLFLIAMSIIFTVHYKFSSCVTALKIKTSCAALLYSKVLRLNLSTSQQHSTGAILNVISNDLSRFDYTFSYINYIWATPLFVTSIFYLVYYDAGLAGLFGVLWYVLYMFLQSHFAKVTGSYRNNIAEKTDQRIKIVNEIISGIRVIKMHAWEKPFYTLVKRVRDSELNIIKKVVFLKGIFHSLLSFANFMAIFFGLFMHVVLQEPITPAKVFNLIMYYTFFNFIIALMFPLSITKATEIYQILKRVDTLMSEPEVKENQIMCGDLGNIRILMRNVNAKWNRPRINSSETESKIDEISLLSSAKNSTVLKNISVISQNETFLGITGPISSGKSSLLLTILGETSITGFSSINGSISYMSQDPWIFAGTIRQNILFDQLYDASRYENVLRVSGLEKDLQLFPNHDLELVGERGVTLSGGQKARLNLARTIYKKADIYLFDDPFSSVDHIMSKFLMIECFNEFLKKKCRILVTHSVKYLKRCDHIIVINSGMIEKEGTFEKLEKDGSFQKELFRLNSTNYINDERDMSYNTKKENHNLKASEVVVHSKNKQCTFFSYIRSGNNLLSIFIVLFFFICSQSLESLIYLYVSYWAHIEHLKNTTSTVLSKELHTLESYNYVYIFIVLLVLLLLSSLAKAIFYAQLVLRNSRNLHQKISIKVLGSKIRFFDSMESGQILSRFTKDFGAIDEILPRTIMESFVVVLGLLSKLFLIAYINYYVIIMALLPVFILRYSTEIYVHTSKTIKRIEGSLMGPVLSHINSSIQGLPSIRAAKAQELAKVQFYQHQNKHISSFFMFNEVNNAFSLGTEMISFAFTSAVIIGCFIIANDLGLNGSEMGLAITQSMAFTTFLQFGIMQCVQANNYLVAVERVLEYNDLPQEHNIIPAESIPEKWPEKGGIHFENVQIRHLVNSPIILDDLNFEIKAGEKIGIVGKTGAGKSSLIAAILNLIDIVGKITIDSIDTRQIPMNILRSRIGVIPQDPVLFSGTLRFNLDPSGELEDNILYNALKKLDLAKTSDYLNSLDDLILNGGSNLSIGQKQLICLARNIVRKRKIIILDEATASVDLVTDNLMQKIIAEYFSDCTVLTIAHRLNTIMDSDRVMVIDSGKIVQFDRPNVLLQDMHGKFYTMVH